MVEAERAEITELHVNPGERRRGIGRALAESCLDWLTGRGVERCEIRVAAGNDAGRSFWRALGFGAWMDVLQRRL
jgi:ribosomal protein S18 acetylase RimI-like enzyme